MSKSEIFYVENEMHDVTDLGSASRSKISPAIANSHIENGRVSQPNGTNNIARGFSRNKSIEQGSVLSCHDVNYEVDSRKGFFSCIGKPEKKVILKNINAVFHPGTTAIMGPTGGGKSSLLDLLAGRKDKTGLSGSILVNGKKQPENFKCASGYVAQDDVVMGTLTIRENFMFSANVRLPSSINTTEKKKRVDDILAELGLTHVADSKVGTEMIRGVSGGERKRTNIGMELIIKPSVLFLDEPTTGLDSSTANSVVALLSELGQRGRTIIFSIHQPRFTIFSLFDYLTLLGRGQMIYQGSASNALDYFDELGYHCEEHNNPADFFLDVINGEYEYVENKTIHRTRSCSIPEARNQDRNQLNLQFEVSKVLARKFEQSQSYKKLEENLADISRSNGGTYKIENQPDYVTSFFTQFIYLSQRAFLSIIRNPQAGMAAIMGLTFMALFNGLIYLQVKNDASGLFNRVGAMFQMTMNMIFANMPAIELFIKERPIFIHENAGGFYRVSSYFFSKIISDILPLRIVPTIVFLVITYWMVGFQKSADGFFYFLLICLLVTFAASSLCFFYSASVGVFSVAQMLIAITFVVMMIFSGFMVQLETITKAVRWLQYFSILRYGLQAMTAKELRDLSICVTNPITAEIDWYESTWDMWHYPLALSGFIIGFLALAYIQLRRIKKTK
ncbi:DgyrCDS7118 [Dimorphilus gyrociliatus]|uniref:DgyrCDS7118 n=1 Tax=Dimorphilus gyrociliatus TaxID=2664684 RepID=A0A7I8VRQ4_9ANNE|nr:DgyrCDS7118 [Dimorphilus gyrociliatus]